MNISRHIYKNATISERDELEPAVPHTLIRYIQEKRRNIYRNHKTITKVLQMYENQPSKQSPE